MKTIYVAHPLNAPTEEEREANRRTAARWSGWLSATFKIATITQWVVLSSVWSEEEGREFGLEIDKALINKCEGVFLCGPRVSSGMEIESEHAMSRDLCMFNACDPKRVNPEDADATMVRDIREWLETVPWPVDEA